MELSGPFTKKQLDLLYGKAEYLVYYMKESGTTFTYEYVNPFCAATFGKELTGTTLEESLPPSLAEEIKKQYAIAVKQQSLHTYRDYNLFSNSNSAIETELTPIIHNGNQYILAISRNVSKQKKIEEDYYFYQSLIENSVDPMIMITAEYRIFDMNPAYEAIFGIQKDQWLDRSYRDLPHVRDQFSSDILKELDFVKAGNSSRSTIIRRRIYSGEIAKFSASYSPIIEQNVIKAYHIALRELTSKVQLKEELKKTEKVLESYKIALNHAALVGIWEPAGKIQFANDNFKGTTGYEKEELLGMNISEIGRAVISDSQYDNIRDIILNGEIWRGEMKSLKKTGEFFWVDTTVIPLQNEAGRIYEVLAIMFDITDRKQLEERLHFMAYHDSLTSLPNRRMMVDRFNELKNTADTNREWTVLLFIDGDDFKLVNDRYGHDMGDEFIHHFGQAVSRSIRKGDLAARMGGDEFLIALTGINPEQADQQVEEIIRRIKASLSEGWVINGVHFAPTASIGAAVYPNDADDFEDLVQKADAALYEAKKAGKNQVVFHTG